MYFPLDIIEKGVNILIDQQRNGICKMSNIIKKAVMQRAHELKRGSLSLRLTIAWAEVKSAIQSQLRMEAIDNLRKTTEHMHPMDRAMLEMELLGNMFREQTGKGRAL